MKRIFLLPVLLLVLASGIQAQNIGINATGASPDKSAMLDVNSTSKGMLVPRMTSAQRTVIASPAKGLLVFDTDNNGFWFYNGITWNDLSATGNGWNLSGNPGTDPANNFIGTTDDQSLHFRIKNINAGILDSSVCNTAFGFRAMDAASTLPSQFNSSFGYKSLANNTDGVLNTAIGGNSLRANTTGSNNTALGSQSLVTNTLGMNNTALGANSLASNSFGNYNTALGSNALFSSTTGIANTAIGQQTFYSNVSGNYNTATGFEALYYNTAEGNTAIGSQALFFNTSGTQNAATGYAVLMNNTTGSFNSAFGYASLLANTTGNNNTAIGLRALNANTTGSQNTAIGIYALSALVGGSKNIAIGDNSGTDPGSPNIKNTISIGNDGYLNAADNQAFIGNLQTKWIGGNVNWSTFSDARIKSNITENVKGLEFILKLRPVTYVKNMDAVSQLTGNKKISDVGSNHDADSVLQSGFLAQEVEQAAKAVNYNFSGLHVPENKKQLYSLTYSDFVVPLVKGMQEQQKMIDELQVIVKMQETEIESLKAKIK